MAYSIQKEVSDGTLKKIDIGLNFRDRSEISVKWNPDVSNEWGWVGDTKSIEFKYRLQVGVEVTISRSTKLDSMEHVFTDGAAFNSKSVDEDFQQLLNIAQEFTEKSTFKSIDMQGGRISNLGDAKSPNDAVTLKQYKEDADGAAASANKAVKFAVIAENNYKYSADAARRANLDAKSAEVSKSDAAQSALLSKDYASKSAIASRLTIGTVATGEPETPAVVTISGEPGLQKVSFVIPRGAKGDKGEPGSGGGGGGGGGGDCKNAETAGRLRTPVNINGTEFDGSKSITTKRWGSPQYLTIGSLSNPVDGSTSVEFSLDGIGAQPAGDSLKSIQGLEGVTGLLRKVDADRYILDDTAYLSSLPDMTFKGDVVGAGYENINLELKDRGIEPGYYTKVRVNAKGLVEQVLRPTLLSEYGIQDAVEKRELNAWKGVPSSQQQVVYTLHLEDVGKSIDTTAGVIIPQESTAPFPVGSVITITNVGGTDIPIRASYQTLRLAGTTQVGDRELKGYGIAVIRKLPDKSWIISGPGVQ